MHMVSEPNQSPGSRPETELQRLKAWLESPQKLLHLLAGTATGDAGLLYRESVEIRLLEEDVVAIVRLLAQVAQASRNLKDDDQAAHLAGFFRQCLQGLPADLVVAMERALAALPPGPGEAPMPVQLATVLAVRLAQEAFRRGEVSAAGVQVSLGRLNGEVSALRRALGLPVPEEASARLEELFWLTLAEPDRRRVLLSSDAWCVPPGALRRCLEEMREQPDTARALLERYADCAHQLPEPARMRVARGLEELADQYVFFGGGLLESAVAHAGRQLTQEFRPEMQALFAGAFVRLSQLAAERRGYRALRQALELLQAVERARPAQGRELRARVGVETHLRGFIREAAGASGVSPGLVALLRQTPEAAAELLCEEFESLAQSSQRDRVVEMAAGVGPTGLGHLRRRLRSEAPAAALPTLGLLSRLEPAAVRELLPGRLARWGRAEHDSAVRRLAAGGAPERGQLLLALLEALDPLLVPGALDEIGMSGDAQTAARLVRLAAGLLPQSSEPYLRVKAIEALGRLRAPAAAPVLRHLLEAKSVWRWSQPREIRIAAAQALQKIDPEWARKPLRRSGLSPAELALAPLDPEPTRPWARQRRYPRIPLGQALPTLARTLRGPVTLATQVLSLGGGLAETSSFVPPGTEAEIEFQSGLHPVRATVVIRDPRPPWLGFEIRHIDLEERSRLRRLLLPHWEEMRRNGAA